MDKYTQFIEEHEPVLYDIKGENSRESAEYVLLVYHPKSPAISMYPHLEQRMDKMAAQLTFIPEMCGDAILEMLNDMLCRHVYSYEYEHWVTCQMALMDNNRVIREPLYLIIDGEKRLKASNTKSLLLDTNKKVIQEIRSLEKTMFAEQEELKKRNTVEVKRLTVEQMVKAKNKQKQEEE